MNKESEVRLALGRPVWEGGRADWAQAAQALGPVEAARRANGSFAVAAPLADGRTALAVDRFGQQTLCWSTDGGRLQVADRADRLGGADLDPQALFDYLFLHTIPAPRTIFRGVQRLPAGHVGLYDGQRMAIEPASRLEFRPESAPDFDALKRDFRRLLRDAVAAQLEPGVPACYLSGGTDSSTVAGHVKQLAGEVHTYSIGFDAEGYDEMEYARIAARHFGARHHEYYVTPDDLVRSIADIAAAYDQPFGNSSALPAYYCALQAREDGVTRLLAGDGGDELFGGNARYATQQVYGWWDRVPDPLRRWLVKPLLALPGTEGLSVVRRGRNYVRDAELGLPDRLHHYNLLLRLGLDQVLAPGFASAVSPEALFEQQRQVWNLADARSDLDRMLAFDWRYTLAESDLPKVRVTAALAGVGVGFPLLDDALTDFSMRLPADYKLRGTQLRWFFKEALRDFLPPEIIAKQKKGFGLPFGVWATRHAPLRALAEDSVRGFATRGVVQPAFARELLERHLPEHPGYYGEMVWILMMFEQWLRRHRPDWRFGG